MPTPTEDLAFLRTALEHAPEDPGPIAAGLSGWTDGTNAVCARCAGRIQGRGCGHVFNRWRLVWDVPVVCATCPRPTVHPLAYAALKAEAAEEAYCSTVEAWGEAERAIKRPLEAARIAAWRAWRAAGCPV
jgi:hypothetical protein